LHAEEEVFGFFDVLTSFFSGGRGLMIDMVLCDGLLVVVEFLVELSTGGQVVMKAQPELKTNLGKSEACFMEVR